MENPRINLLKKSERRHQGAVSHRFIIISAFIAPILLIAILSGVKLIQYSGVKSNLTASRQIWEDIEPQLTLFKDENRGLAINRDVLDLFEGWEESQMPFVEFLEQIQASVPEEIQFKRLSLRSKATSSTYSKKEDMQLIFDLSIDGSSQGTRAENHVISLQKNLLECDQIGATFNSIKLASMRTRKSGDGVALRDFKLEGKTVEEVQP